MGTKHPEANMLAAAGKLILGLVVWVARRGLGSGVGVKELPSECYHPSDGPPPPRRQDKLLK